MKARSDELQIFVSVIECGSISAAAEQVGQTPSAVSRTLSRLEAKLDTTLINRTTRRMDLTEEGKYFFDQAKRILDQMEELEERLISRQQTPSGRLRINAASPFMLHAIVPYIDEFRRLYPDIQLELNSNDLIIDLLEQSTDVAIRIGTLADSTLHARSLGCSPLLIVANEFFDAIPIRQFERREGVRVEGLLAFRDEPRAGAQAAIQRLHQLGIRTVMISGDNEGAARAIAQRLDIDEVHANVQPGQKVDAIGSLKGHGVVAMVGDGINDAPALAASDVGIAMGSGTDVAMHAAAITLMRPELTLVADAIDVSRRTTRKIHQNLFWAFGYNVVGIPLAALGYLDPVVAGAAMAFSSVSVVGNTLLLKRWRPTDGHKLAEVSHAH